MRISTKPIPKKPVIMMAMAVSPSSRPRDFISSMISAAKQANKRAYTRWPSLISANEEPNAANTM